MHLLVVFLLFGVVGLVILGALALVNMILRDVSRGAAGAAKALADPNSELHKPVSPAMTAFIFLVLVPFLIWVLIKLHLY